MTKEHIQLSANNHLFNYLEHLTPLRWTPLQYGVTTKQFSQTHNKNWKKWQQEFVSENSKTGNVHINIILGHVCVTTVAVEKQ